MIKRMWPLAAILSILLIILGVIIWLSVTMPGNPPSFEERFAKIGDLDDAPQTAFAEPGLPDPKLYPRVAMEVLDSGWRHMWRRPRALVEGKVILVKHEDDGDYHFAIEGNGHKIVCEIIPELPLDRPKIGQELHVWGIVRYDGQHGWMELHPVIGWKVK